MAATGISSIAILRRSNKRNKKQISTRAGADLFWLNPHEVIQSRESKRVGANWCGWVQEGANDNMMRKKHKITVLVISWQGFQIYMNCRTQPRMQDTCTI